MVLLHFYRRGRSIHRAVVTAMHLLLLLTQRSIFICRSPCFRWALNTVLSVGMQKRHCNM